MGTDIDFHAEKRDVDGNWNIVGEDFYFGQRNYEFYELLCGTVEPESGLTSRGFEPIAPMRGWPDDYPPSMRYDNLDGISWVLLQELIDLPWETKLRHFTGYANAKNFQLFFDGERFRFSPVSPRHPYNSQPFPKPEWTILTNDQMLELIISDDVVPENVYTQIEFSRNYASTAPHILTDTIPKLLTFGDPQCIRIVFSFNC